jgi:autophagy-related protein 9
MTPPPEDSGYEPLLGVEVEAGHGTRPPSPFAPNHPDDFLSHEEEPLDWAAVRNLDQFLGQLYRYWEEKGFTVILVARVLNLTALLFTIVASGVLLLGIDYSKIHAECLKTEECTLWDVAFIKHPLRNGTLTLWKSLSVLYLLIFAGYWLFSMLHFIFELRGLLEVRHFFAYNIGMSERSLRAATWPEIASRLVTAQRTVRLCISKDLTEHDIVSRIMRKDNYLIGMLNKGVLALNVPIPGLRGHVLLTKTVQWNLRWCVLDAMFNESTFKIEQSFVHDEAALRRRFRTMAIVNALFSPFLFVFLVIYFFMKNAEALYHHPSSLGARRWSPAARWSLREYNELPHFIEQRLYAGHAAATTYVAQFPNHAVSHIARFIAFITGSFAAVLIALTLADERILEYDFAAGRQTLWWLGLVGVILAVSRALIIEPSLTAFDPEYALLEVAAHTHYLPRHWRGGRAHTLEVQEEFQSLFRYRAFLLFEELASVLLTPLLLWYSLPKCAGAIVKFVDRNTTCIEGVGDVYTQAAFQCFQPGGESLATSLETPSAAHRQQRQQQEHARKMEQSLVSFSAVYPTWLPPAEAHEFLDKIAVFVEKEETPREDGCHNMNNTEGGGGGGNHQGVNSRHKLNFSELLTPRYPHSAHRYLQRQRNLLNLNRLAAPTGGPIQQQQQMPLEEERIVVAQALLESYYEQQEGEIEEEITTSSPGQGTNSVRRPDPRPPLVSELSILSNREHSEGNVK